MRKLASLAAATLMAATSTLSLSNTASAQGAGDQFLGQMMTVGFNFCPRGWSLADGQLLPISQYSALFSLLGTTYGGDGRTTFGLPDLRGRSPVHVGTGAGLPRVTWGERAGQTQFNVLTANMPSHNHGIRAVSEDADVQNPNGAALAGGTFYSTESLDASMGSLTVTNSGGSRAIQKRSPMLGMYTCVALTGIFPSRN